MAHLTYSERQTLEDLYNSQRLSLRKIAEKMSKHHSVIIAEVSRNTGKFTTYIARKAQQQRNEGNEHASTLSQWESIGSSSSVMRESFERVHVSSYGYCVLDDYWFIADNFLTVVTAQSLN